MSSSQISHHLLQDRACQDAFAANSRSGSGAMRLSLPKVLQVGVILHSDATALAESGKPGHKPPVLSQEGSPVGCRTTVNNEETNNENYSD